MNILYVYFRFSLKLAVSEALYLISSLRLANEKAGEQKYKFKLKNSIRPQVSIRERDKGVILELSILLQTLWFKWQQ